MLPTLLICLAPLFQAAAPVPPALEEAPPAVTRIAVIGASVSAGFGLGTELVSNATLVEFVEGVVRAPHEPVTGLGSSMLFREPQTRGAKQVRDALETSPTLVLAPDFLFWFGYGHLRDLAARERRLESGFTLLEAIDCPVIVGDLPDMHPALEGSSALMMGQPMLAPAQVPSPEELEQLNRRIREWVASRKNVHLFEMARFVGELRTDEPIKIRGNELDAEAKTKLLQEDLLHPTVKGTCVLTLLVFDTLAREGVVPEESIEWKLDAQERSVWKSTEPLREKRLERQRRREERKRELERKKRKKEEQEDGAPR
jgi:hypothetical protein